MMRDWARTLRRASFRGVPFWVEEGGPTVGRRVAVHNISGGEQAVTEDMGQLSGEIAITGYLVSDLVDLQGWALEAACSAFGPAPLILPMDPGALAHCLSCRRSFAKDRLGYLAYDFSFVRAGSGMGAPAIGLPALRTSFEIGLGPVTLSLGASFPAL